MTKHRVITTMPIIATNTTSHLRWPKEMCMCVCVVVMVMVVVVGVDGVGVNYMIHVKNYFTWHIVK